MPQPDDTDPASWHRYFAATANNRAWALAEQPRDTLDVDELLDAARAAAWHWRAIGHELNVMRARMLLALAHAIAGHGATARDEADAVRAFFVGRPDTPDWETAFVHLVDADAARAAGDRQRHAASHAAARQAVAAIADAEDREIVERCLRRVPAP